ncbi:MAG: polyprenyl synthetase family protein [Verrucomicrobia bacterium]|nr:polyprenyl synthetase family protein [Verrucomicrobiota bacterium]
MFAAETKSHIPPAARPDWKHIVEPVEPFLIAVSRRLEEQVAAFDAEVAPLARYALTAQGKQLRPALVALSAGAAGRPNDSHVTAAVIVEMVHLATLVHDDIMDEARVRRQRPTLAAKWGNETAVLLGDCLFAHALKLASSFPTPEVCRAVSTATNTVCSGEILQTNRRRKFSMGRAEYFKILAMKTGELFALSCDLGAWLSGASPAERAALRAYGLALGTAYQVYDDCLDVFGSEASAGKSLGTDLTKGKLTLPVLVALERAPDDERARLEQLLAAWEPAQLPALLGSLERHGALAESREAVGQFLAVARQQLKLLPDTESRTALSELAEFLARQTAALNG